VQFVRLQPTAHRAAQGGDAQAGTGAPSVVFQTGAPHPEIAARLIGPPKLEADYPISSKHHRHGILIRIRLFHYSSNAVPNFTACTHKV
jgi:hypothetical protein